MSCLSTFQGKKCLCWTSCSPPPCSRTWTPSPATAGTPQGAAVFKDQTGLGTPKKREPGQHINFPANRGCEGKKYGRQTMVHTCKAFGFLPLAPSRAVERTHLPSTEKGHQALLLCYTVSQNRSSHHHTLIKYGINWPHLLCKKVVKGAVHHLQPTYNLSSPIRYALQQVWWIHLFPYCNNADKSNFGSSPTTFKAGALHFQSLPLFFFPPFCCKMSPIYFSLGAHFKFYR